MALLSQVIVFLYIKSRKQYTYFDVYYELLFWCTTLKGDPLEFEGGGVQKFRKQFPEKVIAR